MVALKKDAKTKVLKVVLASLTRPKHLFTRAEVLRTPSPVPVTNGIYAWYFRNVPAVIPTESWLTVNGNFLLYLGIAPDKANKPNSRASLLSRIRQQYRADAKGSTIRKTLGVLLEGESGFPLRRVGSGKRITLTDSGERWIDQWMEENAFVAWVEHPEPWTIEHDLLRMLSCPLNIDANGHHQFASVLHKMRIDALKRARQLPIANEHNRNRRNSVRFTSSLPRLEKS